MYEYKDYFDEGKRELPYGRKGEELEDHLRLLDMLLEGYLEFKGLGKEKKLFSRGLVITESEMESYFDMPPCFRERDVCDPVMAASAEKAFQYIGKRTARTKELSGDASRNMLPLDWLKETFRLEETDLLAVLLSLAPELDRRYERIIGFLQDDIGKGRPSIGLFNALKARITPREGAEGTVPEALSERLFFWFFERSGESESLAAPLTLHPFMRRVLTGSVGREKPASDFFYLYEEEAGIPVFFEESMRELRHVFRKEALSGSGLRKAHFCYLGTGDPDTALHLLYLCCREKEREEAAEGRKEPLYVLDLEKTLELSKEEREGQLSELFLRLRLFGGRLALSLSSGRAGGNVWIKEQEAELKSVLRLLERVCAGTVFLFGAAEEPEELAALSVPCFRIPAPPAETRTAIWEYFLGGREDLRLSEDIVLPDIADCYEVSYGSIRKTCRHAAAAAELRQAAVLDRGMLLESLRQMNRVNFAGLASFVKAVYTWEDITLNDDQREVLRTACERYRLRNRVGDRWGLKKRNAYGNGVSLLIYGPPGTGKTMAAQVISNELSLPLYRVDISQIFSKYIGETEKNLATIFDAAKDSNVILFFDEADALFSKRTDVNDSHDKYANSETAFLLQKVEEYDGMSILATNLYNNFDSAFMRRITYALRLDNPAEEARYRLWTGTLPQEAQMAKDTDFRFFARHFELSGSSIKAILYAAAYLAGAEGNEIGNRHIVRAMEYEYGKLGRSIDREAFGSYLKYLRKQRGEDSKADRVRGAE